MKINSLTVAVPNDVDTFNRYLAEIANFTPLSREEELATFKQIELDGSQAAIDKIFKHNLLFVVSVARQYSTTIASSTLTLEDLVSEGNIGLHKAILKFDYNTGNKFISYAVWWIKSFILETIQHNIKSIRIPGHIRLVFNNIQKREAILEQSLGRVPNIVEIYEDMVEHTQVKKNDSITKFSDVVRINKFDKSLSSLVSDDSTIELSEMIVSEDSEPEEILIDKERKELVHKLLAKVPLHIQYYLIDYYGLNGEKPLSLRDLSVKYESIAETIKLRITKYLKIIRQQNHQNKNYFLTEVHE